MSLPTRRSILVCAVVGGLAGCHGAHLTGDAAATDATASDPDAANDGGLVTVHLPACTSPAGATFTAQGAHPLYVGTFQGFGAQFNNNVYAAISAAVGVTPQNVTTMEDEVIALQPGFVRIFFNWRAFTDPDLMQSFVRAVQLAQNAGAIINITWQGGGTDDPAGSMQSFSDVFVDLLQNRGLTAVHWITIQNEVNSTSITMAEYEQEYRLLDADLTVAGIRSQIAFMGGDLLGPDSPLGQTQTQWFQYMAAHMADLLSAYSIHVYWDYTDTAKLVQRLTDVRGIVDMLPSGTQKPLYVTEFGVRGTVSAGEPSPGHIYDGTPIEQTALSALQHAWFDLLAVSLRYRATAKWDAYFGQYDSTTQAYYMIGSPAEGWPERPDYHLTRMFAHSAVRGSTVLTMTGIATNELVSVFILPDGNWSVLGVNLATVQQTFSLGGLPPGVDFYQTRWNELGDGHLTAKSMVTTDAGCTAKLTVQPQSAFVLTSMDPQLF